MPVVMHDGEPLNVPEVSEEKLAEIRRDLDALRVESRKQTDAIIGKAVEQFREDFSGIKSRSMRDSVVDYLDRQLYSQEEAARRSFERHRKSQEEDARERWEQSFIGRIVMFCRRRFR